MSERASVPATLPSNLRPSGSITSIASAFPTTCSLVRMYPAGSMMTPEPMLRRSIGLSNCLKNSSRSKCPPGRTTKPATRAFLML